MLDKVQIYSFSMAFLPLRETLQDANKTVFSRHGWIQLPETEGF